MIAVGAYIRVLREGRGLSRAELASAIGTHESQLYRIEKGDQDSRGSLLFTIIKELRGDIQDVYRLMTAANASADEGRQLADRVQDQLRQAESEGERHQVLQRLIADMEANPQKLDQLIGYGARLLEEDRRREGH